MIPDRCVWTVIFLWSPERCSLRSHSSEIPVMLLCMGLFSFLVLQSWYAELGGPLNPWNSCSSELDNSLELFHWWFLSFAQFFSRSPIHLDIGTVVPLLYIYFLFFFQHLIFLYHFLANFLYFISQTFSKFFISSVLVSKCFSFTLRCFFYFIILNNIRALSHVCTISG